jgi:hypothetical protein
MSGAIPLLPLYAFMVWTGNTFYMILGYWLAYYRYSTDKAFLVCVCVCVCVCVYCEDV